MDLSQINHITHTILGSLAFMGGIAALTSKKGSYIHIIGGRVFVVGMLYAALSTVAFMYEEFLPLAILMSIASVYLIISSLMALWYKQKYSKLIDSILIILPFTLFLFTTVQFIRVLPELSLGTLGRLLFAITFGLLFYRDIKIIKNRPTNHLFYIKRHAFRMILAFGFALMAFLRIGIKLDLLMGLAFSTVVPLLLSLIAALYVERNIEKILSNKNKVSA